MHVVLVAPPWFRLPPPSYGGIERVVYDLCEGLTAAGHRVTLCAPGDSHTSATLVATVPRGLGLDLDEEEKAELFDRTSRLAYATALEIGADIVHDHTDFLPSPDFPIPIVRTLHGPAVKQAIDRYGTMSERGDYLVAISASQRQHFESAASEADPPRRMRFAGVVHNPTNVDDAPFYPASEKEDYVAFLGRCHWEKDPAAAIRVAMSANVRLKMALRVTEGERPYFDACVAPLLKQAGDLVEFIGEVGGEEKDELIGHASAVIFSSPWEEPFGLVLTESAARGTPVIAFRKGSAPEIILDGITGILCDNESAMAAAIPRAMDLDPESCRAHVKARFDRHAITRRYVEVYEAVIARHTLGSVMSDYGTPFRSSETRNQFGSAPTISFPLRDQVPKQSLGVAESSKSPKAND